MTDVINALRVEHIKMSVPYSRDVLGQRIGSISKGKTLEG